jgi:hypothetical protein
VHKARRGATAFCAAVTLLLSGCSLFNREDKPDLPNSANITPDASTHTLENITINVAPQTVNTPTNLSVSPPAPKPDEPSLPFGGAGLPNVQFDISLAGGAQPQQPLDVKIPLSGKFLPPGANPEHALLYSPNKAGEWRLVPGIVENGVLHAQVASLSPKHIVFPGPLTIISGSIPTQVANNLPKDIPNCPREYTTKNGKIILAGRGWRSDTTSPVHPCLIDDNGMPKLKVVNNTPLMWTIAADGTTVTSQADLDDEMIKFIAKSFNADQRVQAYLADGDEAWADIKVLPTTVQLRANPDTYLASALWVGTKMLTAVLTGEEGDELTKRAQMLASVPGTFDCVKRLFDDDSKTPDFIEIVSYMFSECVEAFARTLDGFLPKKDIWIGWKNQFFGVGGGVVDAVKVLRGTAPGIFQQFTGGILIEVKRATPPCATRNDFNAASSRARGNRVTAQVVNIECVNGWASGNEVAGAGLDGVLVIVQFKNGRWEEIFVGTAPPEHGFDAFCDDSRTPKKIRDLCAG